MKVSIKIHGRKLFYREDKGMHPEDFSKFRSFLLNNMQVDLEEFKKIYCNQNKIKEFPVLKLSDMTEKDTGKYA